MPESLPSCTVPRMATDTKLAIFSAYQEAEEKFDYFVCSVAGALFAYAGQNYVPVKLAWSPVLFEPLALLFLIGSFFAGARRIELRTRVKMANYAALDAEEKAEACEEGLKSGAPFFQHGAETVSRDDLHRRRIEMLGKAAGCHEAMKKMSDKTQFWFWVRNGLLYGGLITLLAARVLKPYL